MKSILLASIALFIRGTLADAATVGWGASSVDSLGLANGKLAPQGALVRLGYFTVSDTQVKALADAGNRQGLNAAFQQFGSANVGDAFSLPGVWDKSSVNVDPQFAGKRAYYWTLDAPSLAAATQWGIYKSSSNDWIFPSDVLTPGSTTTDLTQVGNGSGILVGGYGLATEAPFTSGPNVYKMASISAIPECSTAAFGATLAIVALCLRRRPKHAIQLA